MDGRDYVVFLLGTLGVQEVLGGVLIEHTHGIVHLNVEMCDDHVDHVLLIRDGFACTRTEDDRQLDENSVLTVFVFDQVVASTLDRNFANDGDRATEPIDVNGFQALVAQHDGDFRVATTRQNETFERTEEACDSAHLFPCWMKRPMFEQRLVLVARPPRVKVMAFMMADFPPRKGRISVHVRALSSIVSYCHCFR